MRERTNRKAISGVDTLFWKDVWIDNGPCLRDRFPRLYALDSIPKCRVCDRWVLENEVWGVSGLSLKTRESDDWKWTLNTNAGFSVNCLSKLIDKHLLASSNLGGSPWNFWAPRKVNIFIWRVFNDKIPHFSNLDKHGIDVHSLLCPLCDQEVEDINHVLLSCSKVKILWFKCFDWWDLAIPSSVQSAKDLSAPLPNNFGNKWVVQAFHGVRLVTLWAIWRWRNRVVHALSDKKERIRNEQ
ncbi:RNA-directed DNA polymerase, eukaryota, reverse transcriptase zinc-binding domain protein [Tanacetum coccineum]